ncbi:NUDIX domain-containing protein [Bacillus cereus]|uniref:NUDIX domain-containing protein n=1 Tax=Bacillus cereus TaxID=1396 RepID=UPI001E37BB24|nr:NUDIX domain-containing protein [Bacillus cereus]
MREVKEETGLEVSNPVYKGLYEYVNSMVIDRDMIFNYFTKDFKGDLLKDSPEGKAVWLNINEAYNLSMQKSIRRIFPLFFKEGTKGMESRKKSRGTNYFKENINKTMLAYTY